MKKRKEGINSLTSLTLFLFNCLKMDLSFRINPEIKVLNGLCAT